MKPPSRGGCGAPRSAERVRLQQALADAVGLSPTEARAPGSSPKPNSGSPGHTRESVERLLRDERINRTQIIGFRGQTAYCTGPLRRPRWATDRGWHAGSGPGCVRFPGCRHGCRRARRVAGANIPSRGCRSTRLAARGYTTSAASPTSPMSIRTTILARAWSVRGCLRVSGRVHTAASTHHLSGNDRRVTTDPWRRHGSI